MRRQDRRTAEQNGRAGRVVDRPCLAVEVADDRYRRALGGCRASRFRSGFQGRAARLRRSLSDAFGRVPVRIRGRDGLEIRVFHDPRLRRHGVPGLSYARRVSVGFRFSRSGSLSFLPDSAGRAWRAVVVVSTGGRASPSFRLRMAGCAGPSFGRLGTPRGVCRRNVLPYRPNIGKTAASRFARRIRCRRVPRVFSVRTGKRGSAFGIG